ncbi:phosphate acyltransferase PlsX [Candidatus Entotheonella palauensis]|uniref:phosphate acyltransferase PlsX n=1 Tax=Candidatus Entotheonella palauensis TaxID=93172 RepID=UPI0021184699
MAVDGMGGDYAPQAIVEGSVLAAQELNVEIVLVGDEARLEREIDRLQAHKLPISICHASEVVYMHEAPGMALRKKRFSSIRVATELVRSGGAEAVVSAGNTGAAMAAATMIFRPIKGIDRPAIATLLPTQKGLAIMLDGGANVDCKAPQLFQFGIMGHVFAKSVFRKPSPAVGLLAIGEEASKGNDVTKEAFLLLKQSHLNFVGNVEGKHFFRGMADVVVCDGFIGNVALKMCEGFGEMFTQSLKNSLRRTPWRRLSALLVRPAFKEIRELLDPAEYGGMPLIGINGTCIIAHGNSTPKAVKNAIQMAKRIAEEQVTERIQEDLERNDMLDAEGQGSKLWRQIRNHMSFRSEREFEEDTTEPHDDPSSSRLSM